jgi:hypothetical protein
VSPGPCYQSSRDQKPGLQAAEEGPAAMWGPRSLGSCQPWTLVWKTDQSKHAPWLLQNDSCFTWHFFKYWGS